ncbi:MAG: dTMP kinase [Deltaproteobacteria bacterium]|nr:dTMP kinase [Deltaproteobacteria bacterium]
MFISFEGIEGSGKTTQISRVRDFLGRKGVSCVTTREPGGTEIGRRIRAILLDPRSEELHPLAELLLYMADRAQHLRQVVQVNLEAGKTVLCDRYFDATLAYQGYARGLDMEMITRLHRQALGNVKPDLTFLLDLSPEEGLARAWRQIDGGDRAAGETRFEEEKVAFHQKVREGYLTLAEAEPARFAVVDAAMDVDRVGDAICSVLTEKLGV